MRGRSLNVAAISGLSGHPCERGIRPALHGAIAASIMKSLNNAFIWHSRGGIRSCEAHASPYILTCFGFKPSTCEERPEALAAQSAHHLQALAWPLGPNRMDSDPRTCGQAAQGMAT